MGKKSKRNRSKRESNDDERIAPSLRTTPGATEELDFQDPYVEEYRIEGENDGDEDDEWEDDDDDNGGDYEVVQTWNPLAGEGVEPGQKLEMDPSAYKMYHSLTAAWPSLSFDMIRDELGEHRTRFPHCLTVAMGSQADTPENNSLTIMKLSDLSRMDVETEDDILGEELDKEGKEDNDDDDDDSSQEEVFLDPIVEHYSIKHHGGVNRVRCMPQQPHIVATWSDVGRVNLFDVSSILHRFQISQGTNLQQHPKPIPSKAFYSYSKHGTEGWAMDWSNVQQGHLVTGDCAGNIHLWHPHDDSSYQVSNAYPAKPSDTNNANVSVEDLQWSPTEATVFASAECDGYLQIFDVRAPGKSMIRQHIHSNRADVNVLSWNHLVSNLLATGSDDGVLSVWDLRKFSPNTTSSAVEPLARFTPHKSPINAVEWHPTDESMLAMTDDTGAYIYDLSVEEDTDATNATGRNQTPALGEIPPQLLFVHSGSELFKEVHWHPQISSCLMTTALSGYSIFIPSNL